LRDGSEAARLPEGVILQLVEPAHQVARELSRHVEGCVEEGRHALPQIRDERSLPRTALGTDEPPGVAGEDRLVLRKRRAMSGPRPARHVGRELLDAAEVEKGDLAAL